MDTDLFGNIVTEHEISKVNKKRKPTQAKGYADKVGSGPKGQTCGTCIYKHRPNEYGKAFNKCALIRHMWTHGAGSDIRVKSPACSKWSCRTGKAGDYCLPTCHRYFHKQCPDSFRAAVTIASTVNQLPR